MSTVEEKKKWTEADLTQLLRSRYSGNDWGFIAQVPNGTGTRKERTADGIAMSLWPSKGIHLHGFEIKVSRSDWLREIQDTTKSYVFSRYCHCWWIVAPVGIVKLEELPVEWGLMSPTSSGALRVKKPASQREPEPVGLDLLAGIVRASLKASASETSLALAKSEGYKAGREAERKISEWHRETEIQRSQRELEYLKRNISEFESASGISIGTYDGGMIGEAVAVVRSLGISSIKKIMQRAEDELTRCAQKVGDSLRAIELIEQEVSGSESKKMEESTAL